MSDFNKGVLFAYCLYSLFQDAMGQTAYIEFCQNRWVTAYITVPLAVIGIIYTVRNRPVACVQPDTCISQDSQDT